VKSIFTSSRKTREKESTQERNHSSLKPFSKEEGQYLSNSGGPSQEREATSSLRSALIPKQIGGEAVPSEDRPEKGLKEGKTSRKFYACEESSQGERARSDAEKNN